jgi:CRISPR-associated protein Cmr2
MSVFHRKLYALLHNSLKPTEGDEICQQLVCFQNYLAEIQAWWQDYASQLSVPIASSSDRVNLQSNSDATENRENRVLEIRHPISGQKQYLNFDEENNSIEVPEQIRNCGDVERVYCWFWRFYPEIKAQYQTNYLLYPAFEALPDCPLHSYQTTVSALVGAMYPENLSSGEKHQHPYLILYTFSPIQEFIKASRKFLDFWAGSYLLHYLSAKLCWYIAEKYGTDAVITPSLWSQEIIDALIVKKYPDFAADFACFQDGKDPVSRFNDAISTSLATAGFPNVITALVPGKEAAAELGKELTIYLKQEWHQIAYRVRENIKKTVINSINTDEKFNSLWSKISGEFKSEKYQQEIKKWQQGGCWTWNSLWDVQIGNPEVLENETKKKLKGDTWETYWTAVPLGNPERDLLIGNQEDVFEEWKKDQDSIACPRFIQDIPTQTERDLYQAFNVGTWWGSFQARLGQLIQSVKNTRSWQIATAPGERSTLSGQYTALHPQIQHHIFPEGGGLPASSLRLFWRVMAEVYPGLFNGSEMLNAIELTKRMAWQHGGIAESLGIKSELERQEDSSSQFNEEIDLNDPEDVKDETTEINYEQLIRFPNLSSIAAGRLIYELARNKNLSKLARYWQNLHNLINSEVIKQDKSERERPIRKLFKWRQRRKYWSKTLRKCQVPKTDRVLEQVSSLQNRDRIYNGVMFSSKWLADDMGLEKKQTNILRGLVEQAHRESGFNNGSPADWWAIVLGDGDGMGKYVSGAKLGTYKKYIVDEKVAREIRDNQEYQQEYQNLLQETRKRMGPATHVALNRALLDFSNRLVPYITERRFCGKVVYSGGDDVMAVLPLADLPEFLLTLRAAWSGTEDPGKEFTTNQTGAEETDASGYWHPKKNLPGIPNRPLFTMGKDATMSLGIVIAYKSVPLPTVLETLWTAEKERAKKMSGAVGKEKVEPIPVKDGLCFRVIYGSGNVLEALMKGHLLQAWWDLIKKAALVNA